MLRHLLLSLAFVATALAVTPYAAAQCEPLMDPNYCTNDVGPTVGGVVDSAKDRLERIEGIVDDVVTDECEWTDQGIRCE